MAEEPTVDFGTYLRQAREKRGISLQQVAATTKISVRVFDALERNDPRKLPGGIFSRAFVRSYAREVGLDPEAAVAKFVAAFPAQSGGEELPVTTTSEDAETFVSHRRAATTILQLIGVSLVIVAVVLIYMSMRRTPPKAVTVVSEPPAAQSPQPANPPQSAEQTPKPGQTPQPGQTPPVAPAAGSVAALGATPPATAPSDTSPKPSAAPPAASAPLMIGIVASAPCWVRITIDGTRVVERNLESGDRLEYGAQASVTMSAGNAGALSLTLNGRPAKPLGTPGQVVTTTITLDSLKTFLQQP